MVYQDGQAFKDENGDMRAQNVMDNLIYRRGSLMIGVLSIQVTHPNSPSPTRRSGAIEPPTGPRVQHARRQVCAVISKS